MTSKESLSEVAFGRDARVVVIERDRYGRSVGRVFVDSLDVNAEQVRRGLAWVYRRYSKDPALLPLEREAQEAHRGLWSDATPQPPWEFRHSNRTANTASQGDGHGDDHGDAATKPTSTTASGCGAKHSCKEMSTCEEARFFLRECGVKTLDGNGDGVPCESLCVAAIPMP